ncbi:MAG: winged helix-turn-helix domain-containing protein [Candidatus Eremiobacteraeota bacterium]|nr:winged helix-turn-helix domain-containing protein [Candidatus Eremiobacteraeota bacterium]
MSVYEFGPFHLDADRLLLLDRGTPVALGPKVVETLLALIEHPGDVLTKSALLDRIWPEGYVDEANLAQNVYVLRKVLRGRWNVEAIETIPRRGYRFIAEVRQRGVLPSQPATIAMPAQPRRRHLWQFAVVSMLAIVVAGGASLRLLAARGAGDHPLSSEGTRLYQIGRYYWNLRTPDGIAKSLTYFARVVDSDPLDARGYAALAEANAIMGDYQYGALKPRVYFARARAYAYKALAIDPRSGEAYAVLGILAGEKSSMSDKHMAQGLNELQRAVALDARSGPAHEWYGVALFEVGRFDEAYAQLRRAAEIDPLSVATTAWLSDAARLERRYGDAISYARETLDLSPKRFEAYGTLGLAYEAQGDFPRAIGAFEHLTSNVEYRPEGAALLAEVYAKSNRMDEARAQLAYARTHAKDVDPADLAVAFAAVGERRLALTWLRRLQAQYLRAEIADDPRFSVLRNDPQIAQLQKPA